MMAELVADCPRCGSRRMTFDVMESHVVSVEYGWKQWYETFCVCRNCSKATIFLLSDRQNADYEDVHRVGLLKVLGSLNRHVDVERFISLRDQSSVATPAHLPKHIEAAFKEGATCYTVGCPNAAGTMFRLCLDLATRPMLPLEDVEGLNAKVRRSLGLRLGWLLDHGRLPEALRDLSSAVKDDGNDGAHAGSLSVKDAADLLDFTVVLLERIYTEPERLRLAKQRREERRQASDAT